MGATKSDDRPPRRDHGGAIDAAVARYGGAPAEWLDLSTGINPIPYPVPPLSPEIWSRLPDASAFDRLEAVARRAYRVPNAAAIVAAPGAQSLIQLVPRLATPGRCAIRAPTYNEHAAAFGQNGWSVTEAAEIDPSADAVVAVSPNNPDGRLLSRAAVSTALARGALVVVDESFADVAPEASLIDLAGSPNLIILRSFGKFYGLAGVRLGFAIASAADTDRLREMLGPWAVSGPALEIGATALADRDWAETTRARLTSDCARLLALLERAGLTPLGSATLFQLARHQDATRIFERLAAARILVRTFPYDQTWLRFGLPGSDADWRRLEQALIDAT